MAISVPRGYQLAGVHCRIKSDPRSADLSLIMSEAPATAVGVYTQNLVVAAPVTLDRQRTPSDRIRAVVINSGNANACTGERGLQDAEKMAELAALVCGAQPEEALVLSTGIIGEFLPMDRIEQGITAAAVKLGTSAQALESAARGIMTTDTVPKLAGRSLTLAGCEIRVVGMAKGAGMIGPRMATVLGVILTDARLAPEVAQKLLRSAVEESFHCISVDGHTSTNDSVLLLANAQAGGPPLSGGDLELFAASLDELCIELARAIPADGEGASHRIEIEVSGCANRDDARTIARTIADSPLVKTAVAGADPNWGRIVSAAGYAGVPLDPSAMRLDLNGTLLYEGGAPVPFDAQAVSDSIRASRDTFIKLELREGASSARFWTSDLTAEYVRINAEYT